MRASTVLSLLASAAGVITERSATASDFVGSGEGSLGLTLFTFSCSSVPLGKQTQQFLDYLQLSLACSVMEQANSLYEAICLVTSDVTADASLFTGRIQTACADDGDGFGPVGGDSVSGRVKTPAWLWASTCKRENTCRQQITWKASGGNLSYRVQRGKQHTELDLMNI
jgi:hypothetical protein